MRLVFCFVACVALKTAAKTPSLEILVTNPKSSFQFFEKKENKKAFQKKNGKIRELRMNSLEFDLVRNEIIDIAWSVSRQPARECTKYAEIVLSGRHTSICKEDRQLAFQTAMLLTRLDNFNH